MRQRSEIFDEYARIAEEKGLIKTAQESKELKKYKDEVYPRVGSDDISTIEALYGVKPHSDIEYEYNIMEAAHPKPVVIAPAYDKINALVENENEGQNIRINLVMGPAYSKYTTQGPKLARKELLMELVRVANDMDNRDLTELQVLADTCIHQLSRVGAEDMPDSKEIVSITEASNEYLDKIAAENKTKHKMDPKAEVRNRGTVCVPASRAKDKKDHFPINNIDQARNALARVHQYSSVPSWYSGSLKGLQELVSRKVHSKYPSIKSKKKS